MSARGPLEVEVVGAERLGSLSAAEVERLARRAAGAAGVGDGHVAIELVGPDRIAELNERHRAIAKPTDVLSFPLDGVEAQAGVERELGDVVICPEHTEDLREAVVHGVLHLVGMDHETDGGEMLALQAEILRVDPVPAGGEKATRSGIVAIAGRPNVGKSTLLNAVAGAKVAIVSDKPQTTRRAIRGIRTEGQAQIVFVDLPGVQRPRDGLTARMAARVQLELDGADACLLILNGQQGVGPGDRFIAGQLAQARVPVTVAVNKVDAIDKARAAEALLQAGELGLGGEIFPISARTGEGVQPLVSHLSALMPEGPFLYDRETRSDQAPELLVAELVREAVIRRVFKELPHAVEVIVEEMGPLREGLTFIQAVIWVESESQKRIVIGAGGRMVKAIGTAARREVERQLQSRVHMELTVRVRRGWRGDDALLDQLGIA